MTALQWTDDMGEISGFGADNPGYEAACRRMVIAGAEWIAAHRGRPTLRYQVLTIGEGVIVTGCWDDIVFPDTPDAQTVCEIMDRAARADRGKEHAPSALMMTACLTQLHYIGKYGWDAYVEVRRK